MNKTGTLGPADKDRRSKKKCVDPSASGSLSLPVTERWAQCWRSSVGIWSLSPIPAAAVTGPLSELPSFSCLASVAMTTVL